MSVLIITRASPTFGNGHIHRMKRLADTLLQTCETTTILLVSGNILPSHRPELSDEIQWVDWDGNGRQLQEQAKQSAPQCIVVDCLEFVPVQDLARLKQIAPLVLIDYRDHRGWAWAEATIIAYLNGLRPAFFPQKNGWLVQGSPFVLANRMESDSTERKGITACFGATDPHRAGPALATLLQQHPCPQPVTIISPHVSDGQNDLVTTMPFTHQLPERLGGSQIAFVAGGNLLFESLLAGTATVVWPQVDHQWITAGHFADAGAVMLPRRYQSAAGQGKEPDKDPEEAEHYFDTVRELIDKPEQRRDLQQSACRLLDGKGTKRVASLIEAAGNGTINQAISLLKAELID